MLDNIQTIKRLKTDNNELLLRKLEALSEREKDESDRNSISGLLSSIPLIIAAIVAAAAVAAIYTAFNTISSFFKKSSKDGKTPAGLDTKIPQVSSIPPGEIQEITDQPTVSQASPKLINASVPPNTPITADTEGVVSKTPQRSPSSPPSPSQPNPTTLISEKTPASSDSNLRTPLPGTSIMPATTIKEESTSSIGKLIIKAANALGVSSGFMLAMAKQESGFNPNAKASTSSARGLFQPLEATWKELVGKYGKSTGVTLSQINDPAANSLMAAYLLRDNIASLTRNGITKIGYTEMYAAHFLGSSGARKLLSNLSDSILAASILPSAAKSNRNVFYNRDGTPRSTNELYAWLTNKIAPNAAAYAASIQQDTTINSVAVAEYNRQTVLDKNKQVVVAGANPQPSSTNSSTNEPSAKPKYDIVAGRLVVNDSDITRT